MLQRIFSSDLEFISDGKIYAELRELLVEARETLVIVSPYLNPTDDHIRLLERATENIKVTIIFRKDRESEYRKAPWFERLVNTSISLGVIHRLHSKLYLNEQRAILTSMNFNSSSGENSFESGITVKSGHTLYRQISSYIDTLQPQVEPISKQRRRKPSFTTSRTPSRRQSPQGHCIRCATPIKFDTSRPYCADDYREWARFENENYTDQFCHACGKPSEATMRRPVCRSCYGAQKR